MSHRHPLHCIVPPHILEAIAERGSPRQQARAKASQAASEQMRTERQRITARPVLAAQPGAKERIVYTANFGTSLPGQKVRGEGEPPSGDAAVDEAYDGSGDTFDLYQQTYGRDSIDGNNMRLDSTVHYHQGYDNAFWNGEQMVYGDGDEDLPADERLFNRFTKSLDVIGHELTHGVTQFTANLVYRNQPGALNEHFSDVFGSLVRHWKLSQTADQADWLIGADLITDNVNGDALRSMKAPGTAYDDPVLGKDPQPAHMQDYVNTQQDNGGVHINSGIPNHAFYVVATEIGGNAWEKAGLIWYQTLIGGRLSSQAEFQAAADLTYQIAGELYSANSLEQQAVRTGWRAVGITVGGATPPPEPPPPQPGQGCFAAVLTLGLVR
ncbi:MAG: M4 family metallopeptidase [Gemmatimonadota bacterium]|nr:M4 family metallopeptidase [Gemmatimonadota bacterium]MDH3367237.1 M4 family metallopeptidase [Gemmatimonadota bacterium]MDH3478124.1 M4 family metallopeptidase [Gemmatimonadota bacterium]MDH3570170.1 M4 family metallopeptidase [Gemmatimonadota bacterium]MDH5550499.1 M4 family metallopeptidase [Gemmatimonadota bacterium]